MNTGIRLAINATLLAFGLALSGAPALADEVLETTTATEAEALAAAADVQSRESARQAHEAAVNEAVTSVIEATRLDLDIRLIGRTSITVAAGR